MRVDTTVIIPTLGRRARELERAIASVGAQSGTAAVPLVVVNGNRHDPAVLASLTRRRDIRCIQLADAGVSNARLAGRRQVDTPYFAFLDDDDELLPDALTCRLAAFAERAADVVVTNGYREHDGHRRIIFSRFDRHPEDPSRALLEENWLASAGGLYSTDTIGADLLQGLPDFLEMTFLAFILSHRRRVVRIDRPTFIVHAGAADQASESWAYLEAKPKILRQMQAVTSRRDLRSHLERQRAAALHEASEMALKRRNMASAWGYHLRSLAVGDGLRFLPYTRHIVRPPHRP